MNSSNPILSVNEVPVQRRKSWHAIVAGLGCGIPIMIASFLSFYVVAFFTVFFYFGNNEERLSALEQISANEIRRGLTVSFFIVLSVSILLGVATAIIGGRTAYHHSVSPRATSRLFKSIFAGIGFSAILFVLVFIGVILVTPPIFTGPNEGNPESLFGLMIMFLIFISIISIIITIPGSLLGSIIVFRILLKRDTVDKDL